MHLTSTIQATTQNVYYVTKPHAFFVSRALPEGPSAISGHLGNLKPGLPWRR